MFAWFLFYLIAKKIDVEGFIIIIIIIIIIFFKGKKNKNQLHRTMACSVGSAVLWVYQLAFAKSKTEALG